MRFYGIKHEFRNLKIKENVAPPFHIYKQILENRDIIKFALWKMTKVNAALRLDASTVAVNRWSTGQQLEAYSHTLCVWAFNMNARIPCANSVHLHWAFMHVMYPYVLNGHVGLGVSMLLPCTIASHDHVTS